MAGHRFRACRDVRHTQRRQHLPIETTQSAHKTPDGTVVITAVRDVTERLQMEEQLRHAHRIDAMGQLTGGLAHDFNNLLASSSATST